MIPSQLTRAAAPVPIAQSQSLAALRQLDAEYFDPSSELYKVSGGQHEPYAALWPTSQVLAAAIRVARLTKAANDLARVRRIIASLQHYATPSGAFRARVVPSLRYYDDNNWIALDLLDAYTLFHEPAYLQDVERIFSYLISGWDGKHGGGILWADGHGDRPTVSTAPVIEIGLRLAALTHQELYRSWAQRCYDWENRTMRAPNGLYWDHLTAAGQMDRDIVSYNQGVMIEANLAWAEATGDVHYLDEARRIAVATSTALPGPWRDHGRYAAFDAIYFASLIHLNILRPGSVDLAPVQDYLSWAWPAAHTSHDGHTEENLLEQAAFINTAAVLAS